MGAEVQYYSTIEDAVELLDADDLKVLKDDAHKLNLIIDPADRLFGWEKNQLDYETEVPVPNMTQHKGQAKLFVSEHEFLEEWCNDRCLVVVAGAAPGYHLPLLMAMHPNHRFFFVDPNPLVIKGNAIEKYVPGYDLCPNKHYFHQGFLDRELCRAIRLHTVMDILLLSDIRDDWFGEEDVARNNDEQIMFYKELKAMGACLKFRPSFTGSKNDCFEIPLEAELKYQCFARANSAEVRMTLYGYLCGDKKSIAYGDFEHNLMVHNRVRVCKVSGKQLCGDCHSAYRKCNHPLLLEYIRDPKRFSLEVSTYDPIDYSLPEAAWVFYPNVCKAAPIGSRPFAPGERGLIPPTLVMVRGGTRGIRVLVPKIRGARIPPELGLLKRMSRLRTGLISADFHKVSSAPLKMVHIWLNRLESMGMISSSKSGREKKGPSRYSLTYKGLAFIREDTSEGFGFRLFEGDNASKFSGLVPAQFKDFLLLTSYYPGNPLAGLPPFFPGDLIWDWFSEVRVPGAMYPEPAPHCHIRVWDEGGLPAVPRAIIRDEKGSRPFILEVRANTASGRCALKPTCDREVVLFSH